MGDAAYGDGGTRQTSPTREGSPKCRAGPTGADWGGHCTCRRDRLPTGVRTHRATKAFAGMSKLRSQCIAAKGRQGRRVLIHPQEALLHTVAAKRCLRQSSAMVVEPAGAAGPAGNPGYFGRVKTRQVYLAARDLTLVLGKVCHGTGGAAGHRVVLNDVHAVVANTAAIWALSGSDNYGPDFAHHGFTAATPLPRTRTRSPTTARRLTPCAPTRASVTQATAANSTQEPFAT